MDEERHSTGPRINSLAPSNTKGEKPLVGPQTNSLAPSDTQGQTLSRGMEARIGIVNLKEALTSVVKAKHKSCSSRSYGLILAHAILPSEALRLCPGTAQAPNGEQPNLPKRRVANSPIYPSAEWRTAQSTQAPSCDQPNLPKRRVSNSPIYPT